MSDAYYSQLDVERSLLKERGLATESRAPMRDRPDIAYKPPPPKVSSQQEYDALSPGTDFFDPQGNTRTKPWSVADEDSYEAVPEGADFFDPRGNLRTKPRYESVDFTTHSLFNMAVNEREQRRALERGYPGAEIRNDPKGLYVQEKDGTLRRPRGPSEEHESLAENWKAAGAAATGGVFPTAGAVVGEIGGGLAGGLPGAVGGAAAGGSLGQGVNDVFMKWMGVYDRSVLDEVEELGASGAMAAGGTVIGRTLAATSPRLIGGVKHGLPSVVATALGVDKEGLETSLRLGKEGEHESTHRILRTWGMTDPGTPSPVVKWAPEAPMLQIEQEVLHPRFHQKGGGQLAEGRAAKMEKTGQEILQELGVTVDGKLTDPTAAVSGREAGEKLLARASRISIEAEERLQARIAEMKATKEAELAGQQPVYEARMTALREAGRAADAAATKVVDAGYESIWRDAENALRTAKAGHNSGDFWSAMADKFRDLRSMIGAKASARYQGWRETNRGIVPPNQEELAQTAKDFIEELPKPFQDQHPGLIKRIAQLAGKVDEHGQEIEPAVTLDLPGLHELRSMFRHNIDWSDLPSDVKNGALKFFQDKLDTLIHGGDNASPAIKVAAKQLDDIDAWYGKVMPIWNDTRIQAVVNGVRNGQPADPKELVRMMIKEGNTDFNAKLKRLVGPNLWAGVKGAHARELVQRNLTLEGQVNGTGFARDVLADYNSGLLGSIHGNEGASRILRQAQYAAALDGKLNLGIRPGDTVLDVVAKAKAAGEAIKAEADKNPLGLLKKEITKLKQQEQQIRKEERAAMLKNPLRFLYNKSVEGAEAVDRILTGKKAEDYVIAAAAQFGENSEEFIALRQVAAQRILTDTLDPAARLKLQSPKVQQLIWNVSLERAQQLARDMTFLTGTGGEPGTSMMATGKVTHPLGTGLIGKVTAPIKPVTGYPLRAVLAAYYDLKVKLMQSPTFQEWLFRGLAGDTVARQLVKEQVQKALQRGGAVGAGVGEGLEQAQEPSPEVVE
jgi:hypothetical protein